MYYKLYTDAVYTLGVIILITVSLQEKIKLLNNRDDKSDDYFGNILIYSRSK